MASFKYQAKPVFATKYPNAVTLCGGVPVALSGKDIETTTRPTLTQPPTKRIVKGATQDQLKRLFESGHPGIEQIEIIKEK